MDRFSFSTLVRDHQISKVFRSHVMCRLLSSKGNRHARHARVTLSVFMRLLGIKRFLWCKGYWVGLLKVEYYWLGYFKILCNMIGLLQSTAKPE